MSLQSALTAWRLRPSGARPLTQDVDERPRTHRAGRTTLASCPGNIAGTRPHCRAAPPCPAYTAMGSLPDRIRSPCADGGSFAHEGGCLLAAGRAAVDHALCRGL